MWGNTKMSSICVIGVLGGEKKEFASENIFEKVVPTNFTSWGKCKNLQIPEFNKS